MANFAFLVELTAKPGLEADVETFLQSEAELVKQEPGTLTWHAGKIEGETGVYRVFDTFDTEDAREAHMNGAAGQEFVANAERLFSEANIRRLQIIAQK